MDNLLFLEQNFSSFSTVNVSVFICCESISKFVSLFHTQFVLDLFFLFKQFQSHCIYSLLTKQNQSLVKNKRKQLSIKVLRFLILGKKYRACNLPLGHFSLEEGRLFFLETICPTGNYVRHKSPERKFSSEAIIFRSNCPRGNYSGAIILRAFFREAIISGVIIHGAIAWGKTIRGTIFHGDNCLDTFYDIYSDYKSFCFV